MAQHPMGSTRRLAAFLAILLILPTLALAAGPWRGKVVGVTDGDTLKILHQHTPEKVRAAAIDTPEKRQAYGTQARARTSTLTFGQYVTVYPLDTDRYGRTIARIVLPDGRDLSAVLVHEGLAWWYVEYAKDDTLLQALETEARTMKRGLWQDVAPVAPWDWRRTKTAVPAP